jgi:3-oxoacyl-[acyl-carrier protein] reductase
MKRLLGKVAIITGSGKGIGKAIAQLFAEEGAKVLISDIEEAIARNVCEDLQRAGADAAYVKADVSSREDCEEMARVAVERFGKIDVLCSNAGIFPWTRIEDMTEEEWDNVHAVNLKGAFLAVKACMPQMIKQNTGKVLFVSSIIGPITGFSGWAHYGATKAGLLGFMRCAAVEFAKNNITVNAILPGIIKTEGMENLGEDFIKSSGLVIPMSRLGDPKEIAYAALFLASDEANYITGQTLVVDGGQTLPESGFAVT